MVVQESEFTSHGEVESPLQPDQPQSRNIPKLGRQSSIYSLTLDEFQHTLCESGKNFGSMNMDEFLNSIWTAEENQVHGQLHGPTDGGTTTSTATAPDDQFMTGAEKNTTAKQVSLSRQGSLTLPGTLSHKTVDEVWSEIQKTRNDRHEDHVPNHPGSTQRQPTYGEMTLEDFLVKAGVVREQFPNHTAVSSVQQLNQQPPQPLPPFGLYPNSNNRVVGPPPGSSQVVRPVMGGSVTPIQQYPPVVGETAGYPGKRGGNYPSPTPLACYGGSVGGGYGGSPMSPVSSDGIVVSQFESGNQFGLDTGGMKEGRKRIIDGPVEKVVERRQRRMIKNRESAARSRARKQAYTVELEAELNMFKEENAQLKQALAEYERKRKQQVFEEMRMKVLTKATHQKPKEKAMRLRRSLSCPC